MLKFYFSGAPNPTKVVLFLEEAGIPYEAIPVDTRKGEQHKPAYLAINPNAKVPTIVDGDVTVFDSNASCFTSARRPANSCRPRATGCAASSSRGWMFVASSVGPYAGQSVHFRMYAPEKTIRLATLSLGPKLCSKQPRGGVRDQVRETSSLHPTDAASVGNYESSISIKMPYSRIPWTSMKIVLFGGLRPFNPKAALRDVVAGVTLASMNIPQVLGYARIAGMPVVTGLYTVLLPILAFAVFGSSRHLVVAANSATAVIFSGSLTSMAAPASEKYVALVGMVALLTAGILFLAWVFKLGFLADFLAHTVLVGFLTGVAFQVGIAMLGDMLGLRRPAGCFQSS